MKPIYFASRFYQSLTIIIIGFVVCMFIPSAYYIIWGILILWSIAVICEIVFLYIYATSVKGHRHCGQQLSLGDCQEIEYTLRNECDYGFAIDLIDELPVQFQYRDYIGQISLQGLESKTVIHEIRPLARGNYEFGKMYGLVTTRVLGLVKYRVRMDDDIAVHVLPSIIQMKKYAMNAYDKTAHKLGIRKIRRVGENDEFEHIRNYQIGDNIKSINWKATSRRHELMVNQYQDTRSQMVYCIIDKGRSMEMPFNGLSLLDYAINSALVISNIVLQKYDKIGLITFSNTLDNITLAESQTKQLEHIMQVLYAQETQYKEADFQLLYYTIRRKISKRSILILFTNFEDKYDMERNLYYFKKINIYHLLIIVTFINTEVETAAEASAKDKSDIYHKVIAQTVMVDKEKIVKELTNAGIQVIHTTPANLSVNVINKYLEIKARRMK
jgi:uncharacterized protein (DUF58 family)